MEPELLTYGLVFAGGVLSFLSPCVLPLLPAYLAYSAGESLRAPTRSGALLPACFFVLGFSVLFMLFGLSAAGAGQSLQWLKINLELPAGLALMLFGLFFAFPALRPAGEWRPFLTRALPGIGQYGRAFLLGLGFGFGWTPCIGPILGAVLVAAARQAVLLEGLLLLAVYAAGLALPFLLAAFGMARLAAGPGALLARHWRKVEWAAGGFLLLTGALIAAGLFARTGFLLLDYFPLLGQLG